MLLALAGGSLGLGLGAWWTHILVAFAPANVPGLDHVRLNGWVSLFAVAATAVTALGFGAVPVLRGSEGDPGEALKEGGRTSAGARGNRTRRALVVADVAVALVLLAGVGLTVRSFARVVAVDAGFDADGVLQAQVNALGPTYAEDADVLAFHREVLRRIQALPGVRAAGFSSQIPLGGNYDRSGFSVEGRPVDNPALEPDAERYMVAGDYLSALGIELKRGRGLGPGDDEDAPAVVLVNETMVRTMFPDEDPLGKRIRLGDDEDAWHTIVGVVGDVRHYHLEEAPNMQIYLPDAQAVSSYLTLVVRMEGQPDGLLAAVRREVWAVDRSIPVSAASSMTEVVSRTTAQRRFVLGLLTAFAAVAVVLTMVGIYGLLAYQVAQRTREIGVRIALGARGGDVFRHVVGQGMVLTLVGVAAGLVGAFGLTRFLRGMLFGVTPMDPLTLGAVSALMLAVSFVACWLPARRATRVNAQVALAGE